MRSPSAWSYVTFLCLSPLALGACTGDTPATTETGTDATTSPGSETGSETDDCPVGAVGCPCTEGGGCNPGLVCTPQHVCVDESGTSTVEPMTGTTSETTGEPETSSSSPATTEPTSECDPGLGNPSPDCVDNPGGPYCHETGVCGDCTVLPAEAGCESVAPGKPVCNAEDGQCVACTADNDGQCGGDTPACNPDLNQCVGCFEHSHCPETACNLADGKCFDPDLVIYVRHDLSQKTCTVQAGQGGSDSSPYCNANLAVNHAETSGQTGWTIKFLYTDPQNFYHGSILFGAGDSPLVYALVHETPGTQEDSANLYESRLVAPEPVITIGPDVTVYVYNFTLMTSNQQSDGAMGIQCGPGGKLYLDDSVIREVRGAGIRSLGCDVHLRRSMIYHGRTEGVDITDAALHMVNSFITDNEFVQASGGGGIRAENAVLDIVSSTILDNHNEHGAGADSIACVGDNVTGAIRNSVIARMPTSDNVSIDCDPAKLEITSSLLDSDDFKDNNQKLDGESIVGKFNDNTVTGAYYIRKEFAGSMSGIAKWHKGDPRHDFELQPRPAVEGADDYPGADVLNE